MKSPTKTMLKNTAIELVCFIGRASWSLVVLSVLFCWWLCKTVCRRQSSTPFEDMRDGLSDRF